MEVSSLINHYSTLSTNELWFKCTMLIMLIVLLYMRLWFVRDDKGKVRY